MTQEMENENLSFTQQLRKDGFIKDIDTNPTCFDDTDSQNQLPIIFIPNTILLPHTDITLNLDKQHTDNLLHTVDDNNHGIILERVLIKWLRLRRKVLVLLLRQILQK